MARRQLKNIRASAGFTLIELLLVMLILALTISIVAVNTPRGRPAVQMDAEKFAAMMQLATQKAIMSGAPMRLEISSGAYRYLEHSGGEWAPASDKRILAASFAPSTSIEVELEDSVFANASDLGGARENDENTYIVSIDPAGAATPVKVRFSDRQGVWTVGVSPEGKVFMERDDA